MLAVARRQERLEELRASLQDAAGRIEVFVGDISRREDNETMIDLAVEKFGKLDVLINNAGVMDGMEPIGEFIDAKLEQVFAIMSLDLCMPCVRQSMFFRHRARGGILLT